MNRVDKAKSNALDFLMTDLRMTTDEIMRDSKEMDMDIQALAIYYAENTTAKKPDDDKLDLDVLENELEKLGISVRHNIISNEMEVAGFDNRESEDDIVANLPAILYSDLCHKYKNCSIQIIMDYLKVISTRHKFNPVLDYLKDKKWDGVDRFNDLYKAISIKDDDDLSKTLIYKWFWQGLSLLRNDSKQPFGADGVLTLTGRQGLGKTSFFRHIAISPKWFRASQGLDSFDKDKQRRCITTWIAELGEIDSTFKRADIGMLKGFITNEYDEYRLPYGRIDQKMPRRANLGATVNGMEYLIDPTGNRRFWTVPVENIDFNALNAIDPTQLWLQVWENGAETDIQGFRLTVDERDALEQRNAMCERAIKGEDEVRDVLAKCAVSENYKMALMTVEDFKLEHSSLYKYSNAQIGKVLTKLGYESSKATVDGKQDRYRKLPHRDFT